MENYNTAVIRTMLVDGFGDEKITTLAFDYFRPVYNMFSAGMGRQVKIHLLIEHCDQHGKLNELVDLIKDQNPYQYEKHINDVYTKQVPIQPKKTDKAGTDKTGIVEFITVEDVDLENLSLEQREGLIIGIKITLASVLGKSVDEVKVLSIKSGSIKLELSIPLESIEQLLSLDKGFLIHEMGIQKINLKSSEIRAGSVGISAPSQGAQFGRLSPSMFQINDNSNASTVALSIVDTIHKTKTNRIEIHAIGPNEINQALKAAQISNGFLDKEGVEIKMTPSFFEVEDDGQLKTAIKIVIETIPKSRSIHDNYEENNFNSSKQEKESSNVDYSKTFISMTLISILFILISAFNLIMEFTSSDPDPTIKFLSVITLGISFVLLIFVLLGLWSQKGKKNITDSGSKDDLPNPAESKKKEIDVDSEV